ncbi:unnamed protein product [Prorocentrum cordatum]|uniref:Uncharacterized protein n=1 Tax=Prorocentrum cordatum TaxID=2364126 RepID=A0ABN9T9T8_9DINO|nr:unnamed protein product [Polarella glacialis]
MRSLVPRALRAAALEPRGAAWARGARAPDAEMAVAGHRERLLLRCAWHGAPSPDSELGEPAAPLLRMQETSEAASRSKEDEQEYAKMRIASAKSGLQLCSIAEEVIRDDWLWECHSLPGNIYRIAAFGRHTRSLGQCSHRGFKAVVRLFGFAAVVLLQWVAPPAIFMSMWFFFWSKK